MHFQATILLLRYSSTSFLLLLLPLTPCGKTLDCRVQVTLPTSLRLKKRRQPKFGLLLLHFRPTLLRGTEASLLFPLFLLLHTISAEWAIRPRFFSSALLQSLCPGGGGGGRGNPTPPNPGLPPAQISFPPRELLSALSPSQMVSSLGGRHRGRFPSLPSSSIPSPTRLGWFRQFSISRRHLGCLSSFLLPAEEGRHMKVNFGYRHPSPPHLPPFPPIFFRVTRAELALRDGRAGGRAGGRTLSSSLFSYSVGASRKRGEIRYEQTPQKGGLFLSLLAKGVRGGGKGPVCF